MSQKTIPIFFHSKAINSGSSQKYRHSCNVGIVEIPYFRPSEPCNGRFNHAHQVDKVVIEEDVDTYDVP